MIIEDLALDFNDVLIIPKRSELSSRRDVNLVRNFKTRNGTSFEGIPIIASNMATGTFPMLNSLANNKIFTAIAKHNIEDWYKEEDLNNKLLYGFFTIGMSQEDFDALKHYKEWLLTKNFNINGINIVNHLKICIDIANGYSEKFSEYVHSVRELFPNNVIVAGNVCTPEMTQELIIAGADYVKIGIGQGSHCITRLKTGVGYPQLSAAIRCSDVAHGLNGGIILDGGMTCPGDICKAFCANADFVMIGGILAGTDECEGDIIEKFIQSDEYKPNNKKYDLVIYKKKYKRFYGMSSDAAPGNLGKNKDYRTSEGIETFVEYKGPVQDIVNDILGGLRSCGTYIGARDIRNFGKCGSFVRVSKQHDKF
jgi:GMP reductase